MNAMIEKQDDARIMESVLLDGDLSKLSPAQRVSYYLSVCESLGLNPKTKPFKYITLNGKLTLYAQKDATDQLRKLHKVSIDDVDIKETDSQFIVKVKGHDESGRSDVEVGVVNKSDMRGDTANAQMKAVTKSKRRLTLSICGLGFLDETEVGAIPDARPMIVTEDGEIKGPEWSEQTVKVGENPDPVSDAMWARFLALCNRAEKVDIRYDLPDRARITATELTAEALELKHFVEQAEAQAKSGE